MTERENGHHGASEAGDFFAELPYESYPFYDSQPAHTAAVATLFGRRPPPVASARVLEIGSASGGNLIPLAARFPQSSFVGYDLSPRHVDLAKARISELGLGNIDIRLGDISEPGIIDGAFDYIICHGVFSWVDRTAQDAILSICAEHLSEDGVAYVSYNVLPGWQMRTVIRDILLFDDDKADSILSRVKRGRWLLNQLAKGAGQSTPYGQLLQREAAQLAAQSDSYIAGEFFVDENNPCYFRDFVSRAAAAGLSYLADASLAAASLENTNPHLDNVLRAMAGPDQVKFEQYFDLFMGRQFRKSILAKRSPDRTAEPAPSVARLAGLFFSTRLTLRNGETPGAELSLVDPDGKSITTNDPLVARALDLMGRAYPETMSLPDLMRSLDLASPGEQAAFSGRFLNSIYRLASSGLARLSAHAVKAGRPQNTTPLLWPVARAELAAGQTWLTNLWHAPVKLDPIGRLLAPLLDGHNDREALARSLCDAVRDGTIELGSPAPGKEPGFPTEEFCRDLVDRSLSKFGAIALLAPAPADTTGASLK